MTMNKRPRGPLAPHPLVRKDDLRSASWQTFASRPPPEDPNPLDYASKPDPFAELIEEFAALGWDLIPFDADEHRVPDHPPSRKPVPGCNCIDCTGVLRLHIWWNT